MRKRITFIAGLLNLALLCGCIDWGFQNFKIDEMNSYDRMLEEFIPAHQDKVWFWVRGKITGDVDGAPDNKDEEVVLATLHEGEKGEETDFRTAVLLICRRDENNRPVLLRRLPFYEAAKSMTEAALPGGVHLDRPNIRMKSCTVRLAELDDSGKSTILVSLWGQAPGGRVVAWHAGFQCHGEAQPRRVFLALALQHDAEIKTRDMDKDGQHELVLEQAVLTSSQAPKTDTGPVPIWRSVYERAEDGAYKQADTSYAKAYEDLLLPWYEHYVRSLHTGASATALAPFEYYIGRSHLYLGQTSSAKRFLARAAQAGKGRLQRLARDALSQTKEVGPSATAESVTTPTPGTAKTTAPGKTSPPE